VVKALRRFVSSRKELNPVENYAVTYLQKYVLGDSKSGYPTKRIKIFCRK
jgi:hypothetical protein